MFIGRRYFDTARFVAVEFEGGAVRMWIGPLLVVVNVGVPAVVRRYFRRKRVSRT